MKNLQITEVTLVALTMFAPFTGCANPSATIKVHVVDDVGEPISKARVNMYNIYDYGESKIGFTDEKGFYSDSIKNIFEVSGHFEKPGYYKSHGVIWNAPRWGDIPPADTNFIVVLKRIIKPIPINHRQVTLYSPRKGEPVGLDIEIGDWVFPDGKGKIADLIVTVEGGYVSKEEYSFRLFGEFSNKYDGIQSFHVPKEGSGALLRSELPPPSIAPELGYKGTFEYISQKLQTDKWHPIVHDDTRKWIFRIRTEVDDEGNIVSGNYGWMTKDILFAVKLDGAVGLILNYYYNPDPQSRSLEPKEIADKQANQGTVP